MRTCFNFDFLIKTNLSTWCGVGEIQDPEKKYKKLQLKDRNLGRGYTEWYIMESSTMVALVRNAFKQLYKDDPYLSQKLGELKKQMGEI